MYDLIKIRKMLHTASKNIIPSPSYDFSKIVICLQLQYAKKPQIAMPENSFYVVAWGCCRLMLTRGSMYTSSFVHMYIIPSWAKSPETWFVCYFLGFYKNNVEISKILIFSNFRGKKRPWNGGIIGFSSYFDLLLWQKSKKLLSLRICCWNPPKEHINQVPGFLAYG